MSYYKSRAHQARAIEREVKAGQTSLRQALRDAMASGVHEERYRTLEILRLRHLDYPGIAEYVTQPIADEITSVSVFELLGFTVRK